jgi:DNA-binding CsgD family transcriptional regulator
VEHVSRVAWKQISAAVEAIEAAGTPEAVFRCAIEQLERLAPFAHAVAVPNMNAEEIRQRVGRPNGQMITMNSPSGYWESYIRYYEALDPYQTAAHYLGWSGVRTCDPSSQYETEFGRDFLRAYGVRHILCLNNLALRQGKGFFVGLYRDSRVPFSDREVGAVSALFPHIHNLSLMTLNPEARMSRALAAATAAGLSRRERDVAILISQRMSIKEIAVRLSISPNTVEKHMQHIYWKLDACGKADVRRLLLGEFAE